MAENEEELKNPFMRVIDETEEHWFETQHSKKYDHGNQFHHFTANRIWISGSCDKFYIPGL